MSRRLNTKTDTRVRISRQMFTALSRMLRMGDILWQEHPGAKAHIGNDQIIPDASIKTMLKYGLITIDRDDLGSRTFRLGPITSLDYNEAYLAPAVEYGLAFQKIMLENMGIGVSDEHLLVCTAHEIVFQVETWQSATAIIRKFRGCIPHKIESIGTGSITEGGWKVTLSTPELEKGTGLRLSEIEVAHE